MPHDDVDAIDNNNGNGVVGRIQNQKYILLGIVSAVCVALVVTITLLTSQGRLFDLDPNINSAGDLINNPRSDEQPTIRPSKSSLTIPTSSPPDKVSSSIPSRSPIVQPKVSPTKKSSTLSTSKSPSIKPTYAITVNPTTSTPSKFHSTNPTINPTTEPTVSPKLDSIVSSQIKLLASDGEADDEFGFAVAVSGDTVVVGARGDDDNGATSGSAYIFIRDGDTWKQQAKLLPDDGAASEWFGFAVAVSGDTAVVGAAWDDDNGNNSGSAYIYIRDGDEWKQHAKLVPDDGEASAWFGRGVAVSGDTVVVGAMLDDHNGTYNSGSVYVFIRDGDTWKQQAKLVPDDDEAQEDRFGITVAMSGDTVVVGAHRDDDNGNNSGSAYIFIRDGETWIQQAKLLPDDGVANDWFGIAVAVSGDTVVVGAIWNDDNGNNSGSAYIFIRDGATWIQQAKLLPDDGTENDWFGMAVAVSENTVAVGANWDDDKGGDSGSAYIFVRFGDTWIQQAKLLPYDGEANDEFGRAIDVSGDTVVIGSYWDDDNGSNSGSAYVFLL